MNLERVQQSLRTVFGDRHRWAHDGRKVVFWYDPHGEFREDVPGLQLGNVEVIELDAAPFALKRRLLLELPDTDVLLYAPFPQPAPAHNALLGLQCSGVLFSADRAALLFSDLGFTNRALEDVVRRHLKVFASKKRLDDVQKLMLPPDVDERTLEAGLLAVAVRERTPEASLVVRRVLAGGLSEDDNPAWAELVKLELTGAFWRLVEGATRYSAAAPTLRRLFLALLIAHLGRHLRGEVPEALRAHQLPPSPRAYALVDAWLRDARDAPRLEELTREVEGDLGIEEWAATLEPEALQEADTFPVLERVALRQLVSLLTPERDPSRPLAVARARLELPYARRYRAEYSAVIAAAQLLELRRAFAVSFPRDPDALLARYAGEWHAVDRRYREFITALDEAPGDLLRPLADLVEHTYVHWFLSELGQAWTEAFDDTLPARLGVRERQWSFFRWHVQPLLDRNDRDRVAVIISDALRFEVAAELREVLAADLRGEGELTHMLSALPSQTRWGMAALLPGGPLSWDAERDRVLRGGQPARSEDRPGLLAAAGYPSTVLRLDDLLAMTVEEGRRQLEGKRVVYVYHDAIDAVGDKPASERDVFSAARQAIDEVARGVKRLVNSLNTSTVLVTSDHGFLYQRSAVQEPDKVPVPATAGAAHIERRSVLGQGLHATPGTHLVNLERYHSGGMTEPVQAVFPRSILRFRTSGGGAQYVHGGASLQEMVVPALTYRHRRAGAGVEQASRKVRVEVVARSRRVTNNRFGVPLVQAEAVTDRVRPRTVQVQLLTEDGQPASDVRQLTFDSASPHPREREQVARLALTLTHADPAATFFLTVRDADDDVELVREPWTVSIAIQDDFGV